MSFVCTLSHPSRRERERRREKITPRRLTSLSSGLFFFYTQQALNIAHFLLLLANLLDSPFLLVSLVDYPSRRVVTFLVSLHSLSLSLSLHAQRQYTHILPRLIALCCSPASSTPPPSRLSPRRVSRSAFASAASVRLFLRSSRPPAFSSSTLARLLDQKKNPLTLRHSRQPCSLALLHHFGPGAAANPNSNP